MISLSSIKVEARSHIVSQLTVFFDTIEIEMHCFATMITVVKYVIADNEQKQPDVGSQPLLVAFPAGYAAYRNTFFRLACSCCVR